MKLIRWIVTALVLIALLAGAHYIVEQRNAALFPEGGGQTPSSMPMH